MGLWSHWGWRLLPLELVKCSYFWLSTDQVFWTRSLPLGQMMFRWTGGDHLLGASKFRGCGLV